MKTSYISIKRPGVKNAIILTSAFLFFLVFSACEELVDINPPRTEIVREDVFSNDAVAISALSGVYVNLFLNAGIASGLTRDNGQASDELISFSGSDEFFGNALTPRNGLVESYWTELYRHIYAVNAIIEGLANSTGVTPKVKDQLEGEAKFIRAFCHFHLVNLWGDVPIVTNTNYRENALANRMSRSEVYQKIVDDLLEAKDLLEEGYSFAGGERARPNKSAASAFLARVYLYLEDWVNAEAESSTVINNSDYGLVMDLNEVFLMNSLESIWQLKSVLNGGINTFDGERFILLAAPTEVALNEDLVSAFEPGDNRRTNWIGSITDGQTFYYPFKYKIKAAGSTPPITEGLAILRLAEQYLIRAEARVQQGNVAGAQNDLNAVRNRAGIGNTPANDGTSLLTAIEQERRIELFSEGSHRWFDLKRTGRADAVLGPLKADWQSTDVFYPIPQSELDKDPNLVPQNPGY